MRSNEEREKEGPISITRTRVCGEGKTDERHWRKTKSAGGKQRRTEESEEEGKEESAGYYVNCLLKRLFEMCLSSAYAHAS